MAIRPALLLLPALALLTGCGTEPANGRAAIEASGAWARATAPGQDNGGVFLVLRNRGEMADRLVGGSTPAARSVEIHAMTMDGAVMRMRRRNSAEIPAGGSIALGPGGTHLMLVDLKAPLEAGTNLPLTLHFESGDRTDIDVKVRPIGASSPRDRADE